ncbi:hypothetical protein [Antricoccus suffuscus]|nr:hypothetical protein [Antricoccus suffuscus]
MLWRKPKGKPPRVILAELDEAMANLDTARADLAHAERLALPIGAVRAAYNKASAAYRSAVVASTAARHLRGPAMQQQIRELSSLEQEHLLNAPSGVLLTKEARPNSRAALGPDIAGMDYDPTPAGDGAEHLFGSDYSDR